ncbi:carcinoembryonic antigen-related cell adhesion molecule 8-like isoform X2 [Ursus americanus]|uniref:carcinoembryonic antigen-related cell adhesion molecule 8-like isoform X2 n=1 Tax=Ursus americanus TaxID=9643 RepID=UPI001E67944E|nr:carcinoembryonic antigen-related cell adhesion molecule 8-like isoform X2 [Ursus americanus]
MEPPSAPSRGTRVPWQKLLLAVSLLTFWNPPTTAQLTVESVPPDAAEGKDVLLRVHSLPGDLLGCNWFRGETVNASHNILLYVVDTQVTIPGPAHSGRETIYPNGSLLFQRVTLKDTGNYTLQTVTKNAQVEQGTGQIRVFQDLPKPIITRKISDPVENANSVVLTCEPQTQSTSYLWSVNRKSLPASARLELSLDNRTLTIHRVTRHDTGPYECETRNPASAVRSDPFTLNVLYGPDAPTISPSDSHYRPGASLRLSCHAASNPPAQYSWLINGRPQPFTQELFIPNLTLNHRGAYTCVASNSGTRLKKTTVKTITVSDGRNTTGLPVGSITGIAVGVLVALALTVALGCLLLHTRTGRVSGWHDLRELWRPASTPRHGPPGSSTSPDSLPSPTTSVPIYQELQHRDTNIYCQINHKAEVAS